MKPPSNRALALVLAVLIMFFFPRCLFSNTSCAATLASAKAQCPPPPSKSTAASKDCPTCETCPTCFAERALLPTKFVFDEPTATADKEKATQFSQWRAEDWEREAMRLMKLNVQDGFTIVATANSGHSEFTLNWAASLKRNGLHKFLVFCFDLDLFLLLTSKGLRDNAVLAPQHWVDTFGPNLRSISAKEESWMSQAYNDLTQAKLRIQKQLLQRGHAFLFSDVDLVFLSPHVVRHASMLFGENCNHAQPSSCLTDFVYMYDQDTDVNTGFFLVLPTETMLQVFTNTLASIGKWGVDQLGFNYEIRTKMAIKYSRHFKGLDKLLYANGGVSIHSRMNEKLGIAPLVFHANYVSGKAAKLRMLEQAGYWYL